MKTKTTINALRHSETSNTMKMYIYEIQMQHGSGFLIIYHA